LKRCGTTRRNQLTAAFHERDKPGSGAYVGQKKAGELDFQLKIGTTDSLKRSLEYTKIQLSREGAHMGREKPLGRRMIWAESCLMAGRSKGGRPPKKG